MIMEGIERHLTQQPLKETRNRKLLRPNPLAPWELRVENLRIFYEVHWEQPKTVRILAIGIKQGNKLLIGGEDVAL